MLFIIEDEGAGVSDEMRAAMLDRIDTPWRGRQRGAGLGLAIVRTFVNLHGGTISVEKREPRGSRIIVNLPRDAAPWPASPSRALRRRRLAIRPDGATRRLLADDAATAALGAQPRRVLRPGDLVLLEGDLGAGKTALARAIIRTLAGDPRLDVPSPSFALVQPYDTPRRPGAACRSLPAAAIRARSTNWGCSTVPTPSCWSNGRSARPTIVADGRR